MALHPGLLKKARDERVLDMISSFDPTVHCVAALKKPCSQISPFFAPPSMLRDVEFIFFQGGVCKIIGIFHQHQHPSVVDIQDKPPQAPPERILGMRASDIDKYSRVIFPITFLTFHMTYWSIFLTISGTFYSSVLWSNCEGLKVLSGPKYWTTLFQTLVSTI